MSYINKSYLISSLSSFKSVVLDPLFNGKVDKNQGTANAGKSLKVGTDGNVTLEENNVVTAWETTPSDTKVPSEKLVKDTVDSNAQIVSDIFTDGYASRNLWNIDQKIEILEPNKSSTINNIKANTTYTLSYIKDNIPGATVGGNQIWGLRSIDFYNNSTKISSIDGGVIWRSDLPKTITKTFTTPDNCNRVVVTYGNYNGDSNVNTYLINAQLEEGDKATTYAPYTKSNIELENESNDIKILGWTIPTEFTMNNYVDLSGVFHQRVGRVDLGSLEWIYSNNVFYAKFDKGKRTNGRGITPNIYSIKYTTVSQRYDSEWGDTENNTMSYGYDSDRLYIHNTSYTDADTFKTAISGIYLYYELATEVTKKVDGYEAIVGLNSSVSALNTRANIIAGQFGQGDFNELVPDNNNWHQAKLYRVYGYASDWQNAPINSYLNGLVLSCGLWAKDTNMLQVYFGNNEVHIRLSTTNSWTKILTTDNRPYTVTNDSFVTLTKDVDYVCPSDGYFRINVGTTAGNVTGYINGYAMMLLQQANTGNSIFVSKGSKIKYSSTTSTGYGHFVKLIL